MKLDVRGKNRRGADVGRLNKLGNGGRWKVERPHRISRKKFLRRQKLGKKLRYGQVVDNKRSGYSETGQNYFFLLVGSAVENC